MPSPAAYPRVITLALCISNIIFTLGCAATSPTPRDLIAEREQASIAYNKGDYQDAEKLLVAILKEAPQDAYLWFRLGNTYAKSNKPEQAIMAYNAALNYAPNLGKAWYNKGIVYLRSSIKSLLDMQSHVDIKDPVYSQGKQLSDSLIQLLGTTEEDAPLP